MGFGQSKRGRISPRGARDLGSPGGALICQSVGAPWGDDVPLWAESDNPRSMPPVSRWRTSRSAVAPPIEASHCRPVADQIVGRGAPEPGCRGMTRADFRYKMGLGGAVRGEAGQAAALS